VQNPAETKKASRVGGWTEGQELPKGKKKYKTKGQGNNKVQGAVKFGESQGERKTSNKGVGTKRRNCEKTMRIRFQEEREVLEKTDA